MNEYIKIFGPWGIVLLCMVWMLRAMVVEKLESIAKLLEELAKGQKNHSERIVRIETMLDVKGSAASGSVCKQKDR